jgi:hypothetical protein
VRIREAVAAEHRAGKSTTDILGCDMAAFRKYIEDQFEPGMSWDNHGVFGWHLDHRIPLEYRNPSPEEVLARLSHTNVQPLWSKKNWQKRNLFVGEP